MPVVETLIATVGPAIAKTVLKLWFKDSDLAANVSSSLVDLIAAKSKTELARRQARQQFEALGTKVARRLEPLFKNDGLPESSQAAVAFAVADALNSTPLDAKLLVTQDLDPSALAGYWMTADKNRALTVGLSAAEASLYQRTLQEIAADVVEIASQLPSFTENTFAELLQRDTSLLKLADQILADVQRLNRSIQQATTETEARRRAFEAVHAKALGLSVSRSAPDARTLRLLVLNRGTHLIRDIEISAIPDGEDWQARTHGPLPVIRPGAVDAEVVYPILGGWFYAKVGQLSPNRGLAFVEARLADGDFTQIDFDVSWNDHVGEQRKSHAVADIARDGDIPLAPRRIWHPGLPPT